MFDFEQGINLLKSLTRQANELAWENALIALQRAMMFARAIIQQTQWAREQGQSE
jgi:hypothetical protein